MCYTWSCHSWLRVFSIRVVCLSFVISFFFHFFFQYFRFFLTTNVSLPVSTLAASFSSHSTFILFIFVSYFSHSWPHCCLVLCCVSVILLISLFYFFIYYRQMKQTHTLTSKHTHTWFTCCVWFSGGWSLHCVYGILMWIPLLRLFSLLFLLFLLFVLVLLARCVCVFFPFVRSACVVYVLWFSVCFLVECWVWPIFLVSQR